MIHAAWQLILIIFIIRVLNDSSRMVLNPYNLYNPCFKRFMPHGN